MPCRWFYPSLRALCRLLATYFEAGTKLTVLEPNHPPTPPTVKVLGPSEKECQKRKDNKRYKKTLLCVASDFYPDHVRVYWQVNEENVTHGVATDHAAQQDGRNYHITSRLRVPLKRWYASENNFTCIVSFFNGTTIMYRSSWISGTKALRTARYLRITHNAKLTYAVLTLKSTIYGVFVMLLLWRH